MDTLRRGSPFRWQSAGATRVGNVRTENQDAILDLPDKGLWVVADGMGGHRGGDYASRMVVSGLATVGESERLADLLGDVEDRLFAVNAHLCGASAQGELTGSTVSALLAFEGLCLAVWAGDSRVYRWRDGSIESMSRDHSQIRAMRDAGLITESTDIQELPANIITRAVGAVEHLELEHALWSIKEGDRCLLCTDGLYKELQDDVMAGCLTEENPERACQSLLDRALQGEAADNLSAIVVRFTKVARHARAHQ